MKRFPARTSAFVLFLILFGISACHRKPAASPMNGQLTGQTYTNSFFGFSLTVPTNWLVFNRAVLEKGIALNAPPPKNVHHPALGLFVKIPDTEIHTLLTVVDGSIEKTDEERTALVLTNTALSILVQNISPMPEIKNGKDYLGFMVSVFAILEAADHTNNLAGLQMSGPSNALVGGQQFDMDTFQRNINTNRVMQRIYARVENGQALAFVLCAPNESELNKLEEVLRTVRFD